MCPCPASPSIEGLPFLEPPRTVPHLRHGGSEVVAHTGRVLEVVRPISIGRAQDDAVTLAPDRHAIHVEAKLPRQTHRLRVPGHRDPRKRRLQRLRAALALGAFGLLLFASTPAAPRQPPPRLRPQAPSALANARSVRVSRSGAKFWDAACAHSLPTAANPGRAAHRPLRQRKAVQDAAAGRLLGGAPRCLRIRVSSESSDTCVCWRVVGARRISGKGAFGQCLAAPHPLDQRLQLRHPCLGRLRLGLRLALAIGQAAPVVRQFVAGRQELAGRRVVPAQRTV